MKISIGLRLFLAVLLAILAVAASAVFLLRQNVLAGFGDYAAEIELDRLEELSAALARRHARHGSWDFIDAARRRDWLAGELVRLAEERAARGVIVPAAPSAIITAPAAPASPAAPVPSTTPASSFPTVPSAPPTPPLPPLPPLPPRPVTPTAPTPPNIPDMPAPPDAPDLPTPGELAPTLQERVVLLDAAGRWVAGHPPGTLPLARRAILVDGRTVGYLAVARSARPTDALAYAFLQGLGASLWPIGAAGVLLSALVAVALATHFRRPIGRLAEGARQLAEGRFDTRLAIDRSDELGELASHFNALAARLAGAEGARRQWVADTSHELRTPLAVLRAQLEALQDGVRAADPDNLDAMLRQVLALNRLIDELYALARADVGALDCRREPVDPWRLALAHASAFASRFEAAGLAFEPVAPDSSDPPPMALGDADRLRQVLDNLFENCLRYTAPGGRIVLHAHADAARIHLVIDDSAPGVPDEALARLSERFYRVDASRSRAHGGAGLGLALCGRILQAQDGALAFAHSPLGGLRVTVSLPRAA